MISNELAYILGKWDLALDSPSPIDIPDQTRLSLADMFAELGYKVGAEIGTAKGDYAYILARANREAKLYCVDAWRVYDGYKDFTDQKVVEENHRKALDLLKPYPNVSFIRAFSKEALGMFDDNALDYVYIDANHEWPYVTHDIYYWYQKVRSGGIVAGHDYNNTEDGHYHVKPAVDGFAEAFGINPYFVLGREGRSKSWFWVKE